MSSNNSSYRGVGLDNHLQYFGLTRRDGEGDLEFRKRAFPRIFLQDKRWAYEILVGKEPQTWGPKLEDLLQQLGENPALEELEAFATRWSTTVHA